MYYKTYDSSMFTVGIRMSGRVPSMDAGIPSKSDIPYVAITLIPEYLLTPHRMLQGKDVEGMKGLQICESLVVARILFQEVQKQLDEVWSSVKTAPGNFITPLDDTIVQNTIEAASEEVNNGVMAVREATAAVAAVIRYFINPDEWCEKYYIGRGLKSLINSLEYRVLTNERYDLSLNHSDVTEPLYMDVYALEQAPHWFEGGAVLVGCTDMLPTHANTDADADCALDFQEDGELWDNDYLLSALNITEDGDVMDVDMGTIYHGNIDLTI